jgi:Ca-activated chloride channel family protein
MKSERIRLCALLCGLLPSSAFPQAAPSATPPTFAVEVLNIYVDAFVSLHGSPVSGLSAADFELKDNGVIQRLEVAAADAQPLLAVLTFDMSGSLEGEKLVSLRVASQALVNSLRSEDQAALITFTDEVRWLVPPTPDKESLGRALEQLRPGGGTAIMDALYAALTLPSARERSLLVLFTDGVDNASWLDWRQIQAVAERSNAVIHVVGLRPPRVTNAGETAEFGIRSVPVESPTALEFEGPWSLRQIAEVTGGRYWEAESVDRLKTAFTAIAEAMGKRYVLRYAPENVSRPGWHRIELKLRGKKGDVHTRSGYWVAER